jgi:glycosyltransferase involved in cell wall biosynthesis
LNKQQEDQKLSILIIGLNNPPETFLARLTNRLIKADFAVTIAGSKRPQKWLGSSRYRWLWVPKWNVSILQRIINVFCLLRYLPKWNYIHLRKIKPILENLQGNKEKLRYVYQLFPYAAQEWDFVYFPWVLGARDYIDWFSAFDTPVIVSLRGSMVNISPHIPGIGSQVVQSLEKIFSKASVVHCVSQAIFEEALQFGLDPNKACIIRPSVDPDFFSPSAQKHRSPKFKIVTVGSLIWKKGYEYALQTIRQLIDRGVDTEFHIVGDGPDMQRILFTIHDLCLTDQVVMHGLLPEEKVHDLLVCSDAFLLSSVTEGISNAVLEAMSCELPVVTTECGGMGEAITSGVEGYLVPVRNPDAAVAALMKIARSKELATRLGKNARKRIIEEFSLDKQIDDWIKMINAGKKDREN